MSLAMNLPIKLFGNLEDFSRLPHANSNRYFILYVDLGIYLAVHLLSKKKKSCITGTSLIIVYVILDCLRKILPFL